MRVINAVEERATYGLEGRREGVSHAAVMIAGAGESQGTQGRGKEGERAWVLSARSPRMALQNGRRQTGRQGTWVEGEEGNRGAGTQIRYEIVR